MGVPDKYTIQYDPCFILATIQNTIWPMLHTCYNTKHNMTHAFLTVHQSYLQYKTQYDTCFPNGASKLSTIQNTIWHMLSWWIIKTRYNAKHNIQNTIWPVSTWQVIKNNVAFTTWPRFTHVVDQDNLKYCNQSAMVSIPNVRFVTAIQLDWSIIRLYIITIVEWLVHS